MLVVISGLPGTGKTAVAEAVARATGSVHLSIDAVEDALLGAGLQASWTTGVAAYEAARAAAELNLALGRTVVVDAVNDSEPARDTWRRAAMSTSATVLFVLLSLDDEVEHRRRLEGRTRRLVHIPEPTWDDVRRRAAGFEPWTGAHVRLSAAGTVDEIATAIVARVVDGRADS